MINATDLTAMQEQISSTAMDILRAERDGRRAAMLAQVRLLHQTGQQEEADKCWRFYEAALGLRCLIDGGTPRPDEWAFLVQLSKAAQGRSDEADDVVI